MDYCDIEYRVVPFTSSVAVSDWADARGSVIAAAQDGVEAHLELRCEAPGPCGHSADWVRLTPDGGSFPASH